MQDQEGQVTCFRALADQAPLQWNCYWNISPMMPGDVATRHPQICGKLPGTARVLMR